ncbi:MAG: NAD(P)-dependent glycerol-3-phosphate dehydrogenase, partial [Lentisphaerae bacterium]|nr:NAD(P)-dependent glycerol-3-phosphate dehydrogenase [Lentisphaerota bacterium]
MRAAVLSDGGWGTALAIVLAGNGHDVVLWGRSPDRVRALGAARENERYLPGVPLPDALSVSADLSEAVYGAELIVLAPPAQHMGELLCRLRDEGEAPPGAVYTSVSKGIEIGSLRRMSELTAAILGDVPFAVLSGPSHAEEVSRRTPTAVVSAALDVPTADAVQDAFMNETFRVYTTEDVPGVELAGALKNVYALAAGVCDGMAFGDNTKAALMTRGIAEMARLGR